MKKLYKYVSPDVFKSIFCEKDVVELKSTFPKDFNDPYELFLTINTDRIDSDILAFYIETAGNISQLPTLCFSNLPDVVPMWAHYARESTGFVIELDEELLVKYYPDARIEDVNYSKSPTIIDADEVKRAYTTTKPRHTYWLQSSAFKAAYFTKSKYWSYESERRFVVGLNKIRKKNGRMILQIPVDCVTAIIAGPRIDTKLEKQIQNFCKKINKQYYKMQLGRSSMRPFFITADYRSYLFNGQQLDEANNYCSDCNEPINDDNGQCPWCAITDEDRYDAAFRNPMRRLARLGLLEDYMQTAAEIDAKHRNKVKDFKVKNKKLKSTSR
ncbi:MAG TPA: DUF2971 domain-containing protein [Nitrospiraceae bacterium]|nr:DUF2971 domain-containing protein [Nitrospiraceae bacterium]